MKYIVLNRPEVERDLKRIVKNYENWNTDACIDEAIDDLGENGGNTGSFEVRGFDSKDGRTHEINVEFKIEDSGEEVQKVEVEYGNL